MSPLLTDEVSKFFRVSQASRLDSDCLHLFSLFSNYTIRNSTLYKKFLVRFLTTESRSRHCFLNKQRYSLAAQQCLQYLHKNSSTKSQYLSLAAWKLLPTLLGRSSETEELIQSAQNIDFNSEVGEFPAAEFAAKVAIARYLSRCTKTSQHTSHFEPTQQPHPIPIRRLRRKKREIYPPY